VDGVDGVEGESAEWWSLSVCQQEQPGKNSKE
jgi:hypothetical protein